MQFKTLPDIVKMLGYRSIDLLKVGLACLLLRARLRPVCRPDAPLV